MRNEIDDENHTEHPHFLLASLCPFFFFIFSGSFSFSFQFLSFVRSPLALDLSHHIERQKRKTKKAEEKNDVDQHEKNLSNYKINPNKSTESYSIAAGRVLCSRSIDNTLPFEVKCNLIMAIYMLSDSSEPIE